MTDKPRIAIAYCPRCRWLLRAAWLAQELLSSFEDDLAEVALVPAGKGVFEITASDGTVLWSRATEDRFPEAKELKQRVRDAFWPNRDLGHTDRSRR